MFKELSEYLKNGAPLNITINVNDDATLTAIVAIRSEEHQFIPVIVTGTPEELDSSFIEVIASPLEHINIFSNNAEIVKKEIAEKEAELKKKKEEKAAKKTEEKEGQPTKVTAKFNLKDNLVAVETLMKEKRYAEALDLATKCVEEAPTNKKAVTLKKQAEMWKKATSQLGIEDANPEQPSNTPISDAIKEEVSSFEFDENGNNVIATEGPEESEDNDDFDLTL